MLSTKLPPYKVRSHKATNTNHKKPMQKKRNIFACIDEMNRVKCLCEEEKEKKRKNMWFSVDDG